MHCIDSWNEEDRCVTLKFLPNSSCESFEKNSYNFEKCLQAFMIYWNTSNCANRMCIIRSILFLLEVDIFLIEFGKQIKGNKTNSCRYSPDLCSLDFGLTTRNDYTVYNKKYCRTIQALVLSS